MDLDIHTMKWLGQYFNVSSHDFCIHKILGGTSSNMYFVTVDDKMSAVLRQIVDMHWLQQEPDVICQEAIVLEALQNVKTSIPIPKLMTVDNGDIGWCHMFTTRSTRYMVIQNSKYIDEDTSIKSWKYSLLLLSL